MSNTSIFARLSGRGTKFLVYSMKYSADHPVAMILPLPVAEPAKRAGIRFLNFKSYSEFFQHLEAGFPVLQSRSFSFGGPRVNDAAAAPLPVESVGDFIASYVPTLNDFDRLDPRFRLPRSTWDKIPVYHDYGFAVFQLKDTAAKRRFVSDGLISGYEDTLRVHPMAFEFHTRLRDTIYFPTVHIHDQHVHAAEYFDHSLYLQDPRLRPDGQPVKVSGPIHTVSPKPLSAGTANRNRGDLRVPGGRVSGLGVSGPVGYIPPEPVRAGTVNTVNLDNGTFRTSVSHASNFIECPKTQGAADPSRLCYKITMSGDLPNKDTLIRVA